jgi:hypothetical protein
LHLFGLLKKKATLVADISLMMMMKRLKQGCTSGRDNSQKTSFTMGYDALVNLWDNFVNVVAGYVEK